MKKIITSYSLIFIFILTLFSPFSSKAQSPVPLLCHGPSRGILHRFPVNIEQISLKLAAHQLKPFHPYYSSLYPYHIKFCAGHQTHKKGAKAAGSTGHAVLFLQGVKAIAQEQNRGFKIVLCESHEAKGAECGVGLSVNMLLKNRRFLIIPSQSFFFQGDVPMGQVFTKEIYEQTIKKAIDLGIFDGVEIHNDYLPQDHKLSPDEYKNLLAHKSFGTDYGVNLARGMSCNAIPANPQVMEKIIGSVNASNNSDYHWDLAKDNCAHFANNVLASVGMVDLKKENTCLPQSLFNLATPGNRLLDVTQRNQHRNFSPQKIYSNSTLKNLLLDFNWLPDGHGNLVEDTALFSGKNNHRYHDTQTLKIFPTLTNPMAPFQWKSLVERKENNNLLSNLDLYKNLYSQARAEVQNQISHPSYFTTDDYQKFLGLYKEYLTKKSHEVETLLKKLKGEGEGEE